MSDMSKPWASTIVGKEHYGPDGFSSKKPGGHHHHGHFRNWLSHSFGPAGTPGGILDIGSGDGRVLDFLHPQEKYVGLDINRYLVDKANQRYIINNDKMPRWHILLQDIEEPLDDSVSKLINGCDVAYLDSTLMMLEDPKAVIDLLFNKLGIKYIFLNRTPFKTGKPTTKGQYKWRGMFEPSTNWYLGKDFWDSYYGSGMCDVYVSPEISVVVLKKLN